MKVALINPNSPFLTNERVFPNMGLVRVGTKLRSEGHNVDLFDFAGRNPNAIKFLGDYDAFGFSSTSPQMPYTMKLLKNLKETHPKAKTIIGGPHASVIYSLREKGIKDPNTQDLERFDTIFAGEGEETSNMFKPGWQKGKLIKDINTTPIPDRSLIDMDSYNYKLFGKRTTSIQTQRGCPNVCTFCCGRDIEMYNKVRQHSPERVIKELDELHMNYGMYSFMWYDDEINVGLNRLEELCDRLSSRPYQHRGFVTSDMIAKHPKSVDWLKRAGFVKLCTGIESGSDRILNLVKKRADSQMNYEARRKIGEAGIHYEAFAMIGFPGETKKDVKMTIDWLKKAKPDDFDIGILTPYPGSKIYNEAVKSDKFPVYDFEYKGLYFNKPNFSKIDTFYRGHKTSTAAHTRTDLMSEKYIHNKRNKIERLK